MTNSPSRYDYDFDPEGESTAARVCRLVGQGRRVLELGCAAGAMSAVLRDHYGCTVTGVEQDATALEHAKRYCQTVVNADLDDRAWPTLLPPGPFDAAVAADVLEHLRDPLRCLQQIRDILTPDGEIIVSVPNIAHSGVIAALLSNDFPYQDTGLLDRTHIYFFTTLTLGNMLHEAGFQVTHTETIDTGPHHPEFRAYWHKLPPQVHAWLQSQPAGRPFQIIMHARVSEARSAYQDDLQPRALQWLQRHDAADDLSEQVAEHLESIQTLREALAQAQQRAEHAESTTQDLLASRSWRMTAPLRWLTSKLGRR